MSAIIFSKEKLIYIKLSLALFAQKVEALYSHILGKWDGDTSIFNPVGIIINEIFIG